MLIEYPKIDFIHEDNRGVLKQLVHTGFSQVNFIKSVGGSIRGGHYHILNEELFYVISGSFKLKLTKNDETETYEMKEGSFFLIPKEVIHSFIFETDTLLISMYSKGVELDGGMDIISVDQE